MKNITKMFIDGAFVEGSGRSNLAVFNPAKNEICAEVAQASPQDIQHALDAADRGFLIWKRLLASERADILRRAAGLLRSRVNDIARVLTTEHGKPLAEAIGEVSHAADNVDWCAEEARRLYGRVVAPRSHGVLQTVVKEPVGPVAAFAPWNFPVNMVVKKTASALAAGCSIIVKGPEESPTACLEAIKCFHEAGVPAGVINLLFGNPAEISQALITSPVIKKITFTGSVAVGKHLAALAATHMKRCTMELGGHAPVVIFEDADIERTASTLCAMKFRNAGQVCTSPTRVYVHERVRDLFVTRFSELIKHIKVGDGLVSGTQMGPLISDRRVEAIDALVEDAHRNGSRVMSGEQVVPTEGFFHRPTVLVDVPDSAKIMREEPFGPVIAVNAFRCFDDVMKHANAVSVGLASYAFTQSLKHARAFAAEIQSGLVSINGSAIINPETPFGGVKDSGYGSEGGIEGLDAFLVTKLVSEDSSW